MPLLVKFPVVRQHALRHDSADRSVRGDGGGVEKRVAAAERQADDGDRPAAGRPRRKINGGSFGLRQQPFLEKQIAAGVTGHTELREDNRVGAPFSAACRKQRRSSSVLNAASATFSFGTAAARR